MRKFILVVSAVAVSMAAPAQQVLQCVNPDVLNGLVFNARPESKLVMRATLPDIAEGFRAPDGFTLIGSGVRGQNSSTVVAYKTTLDAGPALDSLLGFLFDEGWKREITPQSPLPEISVAGSPPATAVLCRNGERRNLQVQEIDGVRYANITGFETMPSRACDAPLPQQAIGFGQDPLAAINARRANLPQFSFPDSARMSGESPRNNDSSGGNMVSTAARIESPDPVATLARHLASQLVEQGWRGDAEWNGTLSTGSTWTRQGADGQELWGTLEILSLGGNTYDISFTAVMRSQ